MPVPSSRKQRILVIGPSWVGDAVMSQCLLKALAAKDPGAAIDVLAPAFLQPLFARMPEVRTALASPFAHREFALRRRLSLGRSLAGQYDVAYVLPGSWKSALVPFAARVKRRCGYRRELRWGLLNDMRLLPPTVKRKTAIAYQALAEPQVVEDRSKLRIPSLDIDAANRDALLRNFGLSAGAFAAFVPGAEFGPAKRWPTRHWRALAEGLHSRGLCTVLLGSPNDAAIARDIGQDRPFIVDLTGQTRLEDAIDLISAARFVVTNDSGLMHVAAAVGCRVVAVYGSTSPQDTPALSPLARFASLELACSPCRERTCPLGHLDCLEKLESGTVLRLLESLDTAVQA